MKTPCHCSLLRKATRHVAAVYDKALAPFGINIAQFSLLQAIRRQKEVSFTELGHMVELDRSTVGRNVRVLERLGLVGTGRGEGDRRESCVVLTKRGREILDEAAPAWKQCQKLIETRLGAERLEALRDALSSL